MNNDKIDYLEVLKNKVPTAEEMKAYFDNLKKMDFRSDAHHEDFLQSLQ